MVKFDATYLLGEPGDSKEFRADISLPHGQETAVTRADITPIKPVPARWTSGKLTPEDIVWTGSVAPLLVSERIRAMLEQERVSGWKAYPIDLRTKDGRAISGYSGIAVHGRCGPIDNRKSKEAPKQYPAGTFPVWKGLYFHEDTWDGADVFMPAGNVSWIFVVERVKALLQRATGNILFTPLDQVERMML